MSDTVVKNGRKLPPEYNDIIDNILVYITEKINPFYKSIGIIPNHLTFISLIVTLIGEYLFFKDNYLVAGILYLIGYYFDCADGNFARKYDMVTELGDYLDHGFDVTKVIILLYLFYLKLEEYDNKEYFKYILIFLAILFLFTSVHIGCQEKIYDSNESPTMHLFTHLCPNKELIKHTKFFGIGTFQFVITLLIIFFSKFFKKNNNII